ncbi:MAG: hypothetical protein JNL74_16570 [Fibrobacteres bacterium]|nr:hypothetical protein [Fibrobacterota bacterium]
MTNKENALRIIHFDHPEKVVGSMPEYGLSYLGMNHESYKGEGHNCPLGTVWHDIWGTRWHKEHEGVMGFPRGNPLAEVSALKNYEWPDPEDERLVSKMALLKEKFPGGDLFLSGAHRDTLWEKSYMLVGMENMMMYFYTEPEYAKEILHRIMDFQIGMAKHYLNYGVEIIHFGDDLGTQTGPLLGPTIVNDFLVPEYRRLFELYKTHNVIFDFHSCGNIYHMLDTFIDLGVNILNPIQATANNLPQIREKTMGKIALLGGVSTDLVMKGSRDSIRTKVKETINVLGKDGGYFCRPDQGMPFPEENLKIFWEAVDEFGKY